MKKFISFILAAALAITMLPVGGNRVFAAETSGEVSNGTVDETGVTASSSSDLVVVLDPGHDSTHGGARRSGYAEEHYNFLIAKYCKEELEKYPGVKVYLTHSTEACACARGTSTKNCNLKRCSYAKKVGADVYISFHLNCYTSTSTHGACVFYQNKNYRANLSTKSKKLAGLILKQLNKAGVKTYGDGLYKSNSTDYRYKDGSAADKLTVLRENKKNNIPAVLIEHCFVSSSYDRQHFLSSTAKVKKLALADANAIATYLGLTTVKKASDGNWYYYKNGAIDKTYTGLAANTKGIYYIKKGKVDFTANDIVKYKGYWWCVKNGKVDTSYTGLARSANGDYYIKKGKVDFTCTGLIAVSNKTRTYKGKTITYDGTYYIKTGKANLTLTDLVTIGEETWYIKEGKADATLTDLVTIGEETWYIKEGKADATLTNLVTIGEETWYIKEGKADATLTDLVVIGEETWYIKDGKAATDFTGIIAADEETNYYIADGKWDTSFSGEYTDEETGITWTIENGVATYED